MKNTYQDIDLILAADVFTYVGDLSELFKKAHHTLKQTGLFAFTVEKSSTELYQLQRTIRYAHSKKYIESLIEENNFTALREDNIVLRKQKGKPVEGYLIILGKHKL